MKTTPIAVVKKSVQTFHDCYFSRLSSVESRVSRYIHQVIKWIEGRSYIKVTGKKLKAADILFAKMHESPWFIGQSSAPISGPSSAA